MGEPGPHEGEQQQGRKQPRTRRRHGGPADDARTDGPNGGDAPMGTGRGARLPELRHQLRVVHDLLV